MTPYRITFEMAQDIGLVPRPVELRREPTFMEIITGRGTEARDKSVVDRIKQQRDLREAYCVPGTPDLVQTTREEVFALMDERDRRR